MPEYIEYQNYLDSLFVTSRVDIDLSGYMQYHDRVSLLKWCSEVSNALIIKCECKLLSAEKVTIRRYTNWQDLRRFIESDKDVDMQHKTLGRITFQILQLVLRLNPDRRRFIIEKLIKTTI